MTEHADLTRAVPVMADETDLARPRKSDMLEIDQEERAERTNTPPSQAPLPGLLSVECFDSFVGGDTADGPSY